MAEPQNFDEFYNGNRAFILGGQTYHWVPLHWREWGALIDARAAEEDKREKARQKKIEKLKAEGKDVEALDVELEDDETLIENFEKVVERCAVYVDPSESDSFKATINDPEKRITIAQLNGLMVWLQEVQTPDRPTSTPSPSSPGPGRAGVTSPAS